MGVIFVCFADSTRVVNCLVWYAFVFRSCVKRFSLTVHADESRSRDRIQRHVTSCELFFFALLPIFFSVVVLFWWRTQTHTEKISFSIHTDIRQVNAVDGDADVCVCALD